MEEKSNQLVNIIQNIENKKNLELKTRKKIKGYCRFLRNVIKEKSKSLKEIMQKRFIKWRKDALRGKIKKTVMIRISVSREKAPKTKYQMSKANPKDQSKSVNKNELKSFNINNIQRNITNLKVQKVNDFIKEDNKINNNNKVNNANKYNNIEIKTISNNNPNKDKKEKEEKNMIYKKINANNKKEEKKNNNNNNVIKIDLSKYDKKNNNNNSKNKINNKNENPIIIAKIKKSNQENIQKIPKPNQIKIKNNPQSTIKKPISNISNINIVYTSSNQKNNPNEIKNKIENNRNTKNYQTDIKEKMNNYKTKDNQTDLKEKIPKNLYRKYEGNNQHNSKPVTNIKIDLTKGNYTRQTFNKHLKDNSYANLSYDINKIQNINLYNNNTYQGRNSNKNNNIDTKSNYKYNIKTDISNNNDSSSIFSKSRKDSNFTSGTGNISLRKNSKGGKTTVIQHYSGQRRKYDNYDNNTYDANEDKK